MEADIDEYSDMILAEVLAAPGIQRAHFQIGYGFSEHVDQLDQFRKGGVGENTELVKDIWLAAKQSDLRKTAVCVYLQATPLEAQVTRQALSPYLSEDVILFNTGHLQNHEKLHIMTFSHFAQLMGHVGTRDSLSTNMIFMLDSEISPSPSGEIAKGIIAQMIMDMAPGGTKTGVNILILGMGGNKHQLPDLHGPPTDSVRTISKSPAHLASNWTAFDRNDISEVAQAVSTVLGRNENVVSFLDANAVQQILAWLADNGMADVPSHVILATSGFEGVQQIEKFGAAFIRIHPISFNRAIPIPHVGLILSDVVTPKMLGIDQQTSLLMPVFQPCDQNALLLQHGYVGAEGIAKLYCTYSYDEFQAINHPPVDRAHGGEIMSFVFEAIHHWPRTPFPSMPLGRLREAIYLYAEIARRLVRMGLIERVTPGWRLTEVKGAQMSHLLYQFPHGDFNSLCLVSGIGHLNIRVQRMLIRLGAVAYYETGLWTLADEVDAAGLQRLYHDCGPLSHIAPDGFLWALLGVWEALRANLNHLGTTFGRVAGERISTESHVLRLDTVRSDRVVSMVERLEEFYQLESGSLTEEEPMYGQELVTVQDCLARAWFDKAVMIHPADNVGSCSMVSNSRLILDTVLEDVQTRKEHPDGVGRAIFSFVLHFSRVDEELHGQGLMLLPAGCLASILEEAGIARPSAVFNRTDR